MQSVKRLFEYFEPSHYNLELTLNRTERTFSGTVIIDGKKTTGYEIMLHAKDLNISSVVIDDTSVEFVQEGDELTITPDFTPGDYTITVTFSGHITDPMHGLYPCYFEVDGVKKELLATQFESHHAREVFPCIDEPEAKATFDLTLTTETGVEALSNMPATEQSTSDNMLTTRFDTTPRMSSYLLAFVVGELQKKSAESKNGVEVNVWSTKAHPLSSLDFALDIAVRAVDFYDSYFGVSYPLPKVDHVAIPDFSSGAMENWGLITYRESAFLAESTAAQDTKEYIASVISHELSHQWFGNLVTMRWWNNLWLNESFASVMEYVCMDALEPNWRVWDKMTMQEAIHALRRDAIEGVQAVQTEVHHPDEINSLFDAAIVYAKGARLMRMLLEYVGSDAFSAGLQSYFKTHAYANTEADDLWRAMSEASGKDVSVVMNTWISQPGYPIVKVDDDGLRQERFFIGKHAPDASVWPIPLFANDSALPELLDTNALSIHVAPDVLLNTGDRAHFLTHYSAERLAALRGQIARSELSAVDRLRLLHEQSLLVESETQNAGELVPLLLAYHSNTEEPVWAMVSTVARSLRTFVEGNEAATKQLGNFYKELVKIPFERYGWWPKQDETATDAQLRGDVLNLVVHAHDTALFADAVTMFETTPVENIDANIRVSVLRAALLDDDTRFEALFELYKTTSSPELKHDLMYSLSSVTSPLAQKAMLLALGDSSIIRPQDLKLWLMLLLHTPGNRYATWRWIVDSWAWIDKSFASDKSYERFLQYCGNYLSTQKELDEFLEFVANKREVPALARTIAVAEKQIAARVSLLENQSHNVITALERSF